MAKHNWGLKQIDWVWAWGLVLALAILLGPAATGSAAAKGIPRAGLNLRTLVKHHSKPLCGSAKPGRARCLSYVATNSDGAPLTGATPVAAEL